MGVCELGGRERELERGLGGGKGAGRILEDGKRVREDFLRREIAGGFLAEERDRGRIH